MAHKYITKVRYDSQGKHISQVQTFSDGSFNVMTRQAVISEINSKTSTFQSMPPKPPPGTGYDVGANIIVFTVNNVQYIKTVNDYTERDNLDHLPRF